MRCVQSLALTMTTVVTAVAAGVEPSYAAGSVVLIGAADIAHCDSEVHSKTAALIKSVPGMVFTAGDSQQNQGTSEQYDECYDPAWGQFKSRTRPAPGNHDYKTAKATGYFNYFGSQAGNASKGYYSYNLGDTWHVVVLNSNCSEIGGCARGSTQETWLRADLARNARPCTVAYWHHPLFSSATTYQPDGAVLPLFQALYDHGTEVVINGHNHFYERFAQQDPSGRPDPARGIREFIVGTGGTSASDFVPDPADTSEARKAETPGVLKLTLKAAGYEWKFVPVSGQTYTDSGSGTCHGT